MRYAKIFPIIYFEDCKIRCRQGYRYRGNRDDSGGRARGNFRVDLPAALPSPRPSPAYSPGRQRSTIRDYIKASIATHIARRFSYRSATTTASPSTIRSRRSITVSSRFSGPHRKYMQTIYFAITSLTFV